MNYTLYRAESLTNMNTDALVRRKNRNCMKGAIKLSNHCILMRRRRYETIQDDRPLPALLFHGQIFLIFFFCDFSPSFFPCQTSRSTKFNCYRISRFVGSLQQVQGCFLPRTGRSGETKHITRCFDRHQIPE